MKQSIFKKELTATGEYGTNTAEIVATMNYTTKNITGTNASTHDDYMKAVPVHKVEVFINMKIWKSVNDLRSETEVLDNSTEFIRQARMEIEKLANTKPQESFTDKMLSIFK